MSRQTAFFLFIGLFVTLFYNVSKFHIIWIAPAAYILPFILLQRKLSKGMAEISAAINPLIGTDIEWKEVIRIPFRVKSFDKGGTVILPDGKVKSESKFKPYGQLHVESPGRDKPMRLPIIHSDDFRLATEIFNNQFLSGIGNPDHSLELLVTDYPERTLPNGMSASLSHPLHFVLVPRGSIERYYDKYGTQPDDITNLKRLFGSFTWAGELKVFPLNETPDL